ncbi:S-adenosyl-L-methionine-dependentmethyltransferases superfamily protein [Striga asiatica]|uniref:Calmodulin-lysine N-methyltransferase n=1 Tax=Striga asiatica TaxID=4170 RepID=A0A5A7QPA2_STRAF|nr:S-adenosyl-L-methionine-dependentmethyltransferases superfamily protein [Striga asiatica]
MEPARSHSSPRPSALRWQILRRALLRRHTSNSSEEIILDKVSRRTRNGFDLIPSVLVNDGGEEGSDALPKKDACFCYSLPLPNAPKLFLRVIAYGIKAVNHGCMSVLWMYMFVSFVLINPFTLSTSIWLQKISLLRYISSCSLVDLAVFVAIVTQYIVAFSFVSAIADMCKIMKVLLCSQRWEDCLDLNDYKVCNQYDIDNTGLICQWPSEDVLAYYSLSHLSLFRGKKVIELGSGYGLAGFVIATATDASEVVISDGNPQVVDYIQRNIDANSASFCSTKVKSMVLHWDQVEGLDICGAFDLVVASDCTFFKEFHEGLARTIRCLLKEDGPSEAILFSPQRGDSLEKFMVEVKDSGLHITITETYDTEVWARHIKYSEGDRLWPNYESDHCYPLLISITR